MKNRKTGSESKDKENEVQNELPFPKDDKKSSSVSKKKSDCVAYRIRLLDSAQENLEINISKNDIGQHLFSLLCEKLGGLYECDYFGLRFTDKHNQRQWLDLGRSVKKQLHDSLSNALSFRVKHYPERPLEDFHQEISQYFLYLQIRRDLVQGRLQCPINEIPDIGGLILQAELGDAPENETDIENKINSEGSSTHSLDSDKKPSDFGSLSSPISPDQKISPQKPTTVEAFFRNFKIVYNQTKKLETKIAEKYKLLRGLTNRDAEIEILKRVSKFETYGVEPFPVKLTNMKSPKEIKSKLLSKKNERSETSEVGQSPAGSSDLPATSYSDIKQTNETIPMYLGLRTDGLTVFIGLKPNETITWNRMQRFACEGKNFLVFADPEQTLSESTKKRKKLQQYEFRCENKAAALALWTWTIDRKSFFTLKAASEAKKTKTSTNIFRRSHTYKFIGKSQMELKNIESLPEPIRQPDFIRVSSLRRPRCSPESPHKSRGDFSTLPTRLKPVVKSENYVEIHNPDEREVALASLAENETNEEITNESFTPETPENISGSLLHDGNPAHDESEIPICPTNIPQSEFEQPLTTVDTGISTQSEASFPDDEVLVLRERKKEETTVIGKSDLESIRAVEAIDKALDVHDTGSRNDYDRTLFNGPTVENSKFELIPREDDSHRRITRVARTTFVFIGIFWFAALIFALETRSRPGQSGIWPSAAVRIRGLPFVSSFNNYVYSPIRGHIFGGESTISP